MQATAIYADRITGITDYKRSPTVITNAPGEGVLLVLQGSKPAFYAIPKTLYEYAEQHLGWDLEVLFNELVEKKPKPTTLPIFKNSPLTVAKANRGLLVVISRNQPAIYVVDAESYEHAYRKLSAEGIDLEAFFRQFQAKSLLQ